MSKYLADVWNEEEEKMQNFFNEMDEEVREIDKFNTINPIKIKLLEARQEAISIFNDSDSCPISKELARDIAGDILIMIKAYFNKEEK